MRWKGEGVLGSSKKGVGVGVLGEACHMREGAPTHLKYFSRIFQVKGGVTSQGGRTTLGFG
jgi:hypothetical protein